jgi:hypothetical protein
MTFDEINNLTFEECEKDVESRLLLKHEFEYVVNEDDEEVPVIPTFTEAELLAEFELYKAELVFIETERLRIKALQDRIDLIKDISGAHMQLNPDIPNIKLFLKQNVLDNPNHSSAETLLSQYETKAQELENKRLAELYKEKRRNEYPSIQDLVVAMFENDVEKIIELEAARQVIKAKYPKPE